jgi:hypothetical protein
MGNNTGNSIAVDNSGNAYVTGVTDSSDLPTTASAYDRTFGGGRYDAYVTKVNAAGSSLLYSTFLGGSDNDYGYGIAVDNTGNAYVTGGTFSPDFPTTSGAYNQTPGGWGDVFVTKLNPAGSSLVYSTFIGGWSTEGGYSIAVDNSGNAYVTGSTSSSDFPTTSGTYNQTYGGSWDAFVTKLNPAGSSLVYSTFLGESGGDQGNSIVVDLIGTPYVTGYTESSDFPTSGSAYNKTYGGSGDAFVTKLTQPMTSLYYSTFLGGSGIDEGSSIAVDGSDFAYVTGDTYSSDFPTTSGAYNQTFGGGSDAFVAKFTMVHGDRAGVFRPSNHMFYLKNGTKTTSVNWGVGTDIPVTGNWNRDGLTDVGVFRPSNHMFYLKNGTKTTSQTWGISTDTPVTGDWNGDGLADVGVFRNSTHMFYLKNGTKTTSVNWGINTDLPVTGDWNGDGLTDVGVFRPSNHMFYLKNGTKTTAVNWGISTDKPVTGKWS